MGSEGYIGCSRLVVDATVVAVRNAPQRGHVMLTLAVREWIQPVTGPGRVEIDVLDPEAHADVPFRVGRRELLVVWKDPTRLVERWRGDAIAVQRQVIVRARPHAVEMDARTCDAG